jgi:hypothetical protein
LLSVKRAVLKPFEKQVNSLRSLRRDVSVLRIVVSRLRRRIVVRRWCIIVIRVSTLSLPPVSTAVVIVP